MKQQKKMRLLSVLLSLVLVAGLLPGLAMKAAAAGPYDFGYAYDCQRSPDFPKKTGAFYVNSFQNPYGSDGSKLSYSSISGKRWTLTYLRKFGEISNPGDNLTYIATRVANEYGVDVNSIEIYQLTIGDTYIAKGAIVAHEQGSKAVFIGDSLGSSRGGAGYLLSVDDLSGNTSDVYFNNFQDATAYAHTHTWEKTTTGNGTLEAKTTITCTATGCSLTGPAMEVSLKAANVTLPGDVFCAQISPAPNARAASPLDVSTTPGYKYSADGSNFEDINPQTFTPKPGIYQASIVVSEGNAQVENLYVKYTVSDPAVTAATGDNRPIALMLVGLTAFATMAAVAFLLDSRRRARF